MHTLLLKDFEQLVFFFLLNNLRRDQCNSFLLRERFLPLVCTHLRLGNVGDVLLCNCNSLFDRWLGCAIEDFTDCDIGRRADRDLL